MPKAKSSKRPKFDYDKNRKKIKKKFKKARAPRIECPQIRNAWNEKKSVAKNLRDMGLALDPNKVIPVHQGVACSTHIVRKPHVVKALEAEASIPTEDLKTLSADLIEYVQHMVREHQEDYKAMAHDEKNYYQDTPKQIRRKVEEYRRCHPTHYASFMESL